MRRDQQVASMCGEHRFGYHPTSGLIIRSCVSRSSSAFQVQRRKLHRKSILDLLKLAHGSGYDGGELTTEFSSRAGCEEFMPRKAVMLAPSAAAAGSACPWFVAHHRTT